MALSGRPPGNGSGITKWTTYWHAALTSPSGGIFLKTPDPFALKSNLYAARARSHDPSISHLQIRTSPLDPKGELFIFNPAVFDGG